MATSALAVQPTTSSYRTWMRHKALQAFSRQLAYASNSIQAARGVVMYNPPQQSRSTKPTQPPPPLQHRHAQVRLLQDLLCPALVAYPAGGLPLLPLTLAPAWKKVHNLLLCLRRALLRNLLLWACGAWKKMQAMHAALQQTAHIASRPPPIHLAQHLVRPTQSCWWTAALAQSWAPQTPG